LIVGDTTEAGFTATTGVICWKTVALAPALSIGVLDHVEIAEILCFFFFFFFFFFFGAVEGGWIVTILHFITLLA
jgi:hypothetical protein